LTKLPRVSGRECIDRGTLRVIILQSGLSVEEFVELLH
jgi:hypothetical protein